MSPLRVNSLLAQLGILQLSLNIQIRGMDKNSCTEHRIWPSLVKSLIKLLFRRDSLNKLIDSSSHINFSLIMVMYGQGIKVCPQYRLALRQLEISVVLIQ